MLKEQPTTTAKVQAREGFQRWLTSIAPQSLVAYTLTMNLNFVPSVDSVRHNTASVKRSAADIK